MYSAVKGMNDIYGAESSRWAQMEAVVKNTLKGFGYNEIKTPVVEELALFKRGIGEATDVVQKEMYVFEDKKGRMLALRPEGTAGVVRAFLERNIASECGLPAKLFYIGPNFRYERPQKGRYRQFYQTGIEVFGDASPEMDAEVVFAMSSIINAFSIDAVIRINSIGCKKCRENYRKALLDFLKGIEGSLCGDCRVRIDQNPLRVLDCKKDNLRETHPDVPKTIDYLCDECASDFKRVTSSLDILKVKYEVDPFIVRGLDYYTKTVFEIVADTGGSQNSIAGGGRYDNLVEEFGGEHTPATGAAFGMERLFSMIPDDFFAEEPCFYAFTMEDAGIPKIIELLALSVSYGKKFIADYTPRKMKAGLKRANRFNARGLFILGEEEIKAGKVIYKDMVTGEQQEFSVSDKNAMDKVFGEK